MESDFSSVEQMEIYEMPLELTIQCPISDPFLMPKEYFTLLTAKGLRDGLQEEDIELFLGEVWADNRAFSTGLFTRRFLIANPEEKARADAFLKAKGIDRLSLLIKYFEDAYYPSPASDETKWQHILTGVPLLDRHLRAFLSFETTQESLARILKIKRKLDRMPRLESSLDKSGFLMVDDMLPGFFHPRDAALIGVLGMLVGLVVVTTAHMPTK